MTDTRERLAIAAMHGVDPAKVHSGGEPDFTSLDVAGAMGIGHLTKLQGYLLLAKFCGMNDRGTRAAIWAGAMMVVERIWPDWFGDKTLDAIVKSAVADVVPPDREPGQQVAHGKCRACAGTGTDWLAVPPIPCHPCSGTGRAEGWALNSKWRERHAKIVRELELLEQEAIDQMRMY